MTEVRRIDPETGFIREFREVFDRVKSLETRPAGNIVIRQTLTTEDPETGVKTTIGQLPDGSYGFQPFIGDIVPPPVATQPVVASQPGIFTVSWDGLFVANEDQPKDFQHVNVVGHKMDGATTLSSSVVGVLRLPSETVYVTQDVALLGETWQFSLESEDYNGNLAARGLRSASVTMDSIISDQGVTDALAALQADADAAAQSAADAQQAADDAQAYANGVATNLSSTNQAVTAAQLKADQAFNNAATAATAAGNAQTTADGKNRVWYQTTAPTGTGHHNGDQWFDTDDGNKLYLWTGAAWVGFQDAAIATAQTTADTAVTSANGKNKNYYQTTQPSGGTYISGDLWFDTDDGYKMYTYTGSTWQVTQDSNTALTTANSKIKTFIQGTTPTASATGDLWIDTANGNQIKRWSGAAWVDARDTTISAAQTTANTALTSANGKNKVYYQTAMPTGGTYILGDTWFDTDDGNKIYVHNGTTFVASQDASIATAQTAANNAQTTANTAVTTANSKTKTYFQTASPGTSGNTTGDIWFDTDDGNKVYVWNGTAWTNAQDASIAAAQTSANGKNTIFYQTAAPSTSNRVTGDTWFDTDDGNKIYVWNGSAWTVSQDATIATAQTTANSKTKTFIQGTSPTATTVGDIWIDTANGNVLKTWEGSSWVTRADAAIATAQTQANTALTSANGKNRVYYQTAMPTGGTYILGDTWFDTDDGNKIYVHNGTTFVASQDSGISLSMSGAFPSEADTANPNKWLFTKYLKTTPANTIPAYSDIIGLTGTTSLVADGANLVQNSGDNYVGQLRTIVNVVSSKTIAVTATHDDGGRIYVDGVPVYSAATYTSGVAISFTLSAGTHIIDLMWAEQAGGDGWFSISPTFGSQVTTMYAPVLVGQTNTTANSALTTANSKTKTYFQTTQPSTSGNTVGDTWFDTANGNKVYVWNGSAWTVAQDAAIAAAQTSANGKNTVFYQTTAPATTGRVIGDTWFDTANGYRISVWNGSAWTLSQDASIAAAQGTANTATTTANSKIKTFIQGTAPTATTTGDIWIDTANGNVIKAWSGSAWTSYQDTAIAAAQTQANTALTSANGKNKIYYQTAMPTGGTYIVGDTWFDTDDGNKIYIYNGTTFVVSQDASIATAQTAANTAQTTANTANTTANSKTKTFVQGTAPTATTTGDIWIDTANGNVIKVWDGTTWVNRADAAIATAQAAATTAQTSANGKNTIISAASAPATAGHIAGDIWFDTTNGNKPMVFSGSAWVTAQDASIATAQTAAVAAQTTANGKTKTFIQSTAPTATTTGDIWIDTANGNVIKTWEGSSWINRADTAIATAQAAANTAQTSANGKNTIISAASAPATAGHIAGDIWFDTSNGNKPMILSGTAWVSAQDASIATAQTAANAAQTTANGKNTIISAASAPATAGHINGDIWFDTSNGNKPMVLSGTAWVTAQDASIATAQTAANTAQTTANGKNTVISAASAPATAGHINGDIWFDTSNGNKPMVFSTNTWVTAQDASIATAQSAAVAAQTTANSKTKTFIQGTTPTATTVGDIWIDTANGNVIKTWEGSSWINRADAAIAAAQTAANTAQTAANGKNTIISAASAPATAGHINGDIWFDTSNGNKPMVFSTNTWVSAQDASIATAQTAANTAQTTANGKNTATYSASAATGSGVRAGDIWFQTNGSNIIIGQWQWSGSAWIQQTIDSVVIANLDAAKIVAGTITSAKIAAGTIVSSNIATDTITAGNIAAGAITASELSAGSVQASHLTANSVSATAMVANTITAGQIASGTITAGQIAAGTITATQIATDTITAGNIAAGAITASELSAGSVQASHLTANSVSATAMVANTITAGQIASGTITATQIAAGTITATQIATDTITAGNIAAGAVTASELSAGSVQASHLTANSVSATAMVANTITAGQIAAGTITAAQIAAGTVTATQIATDTITAGNIAAGAITASELSAGSVQASHMTANSVAASAMVANTITAGQIAAGTITATQIAAGTITATQIAADTITAGQIAADAITSAELAAGSITAAKGQISNLAVGTAQIQDTAITTAKIANLAVTDAQIASATITSAKIANLDAAKITTGTLDANRIAANTVTADKLTIGDFENLADDPDFNTGLGWGISGQTSLAAISLGVEGQPTNALKMIANTTVIDSLNKMVISVKAGDKLYGSVMVKQDGNATMGNIQLSTTAKNADGTLAYPLFSQVASTTISTVWTEVKGVLTVPANVVSLQVRLSVRNDVTAGVFYWDRVVIRRQNTAVTIADGTIVANSAIISNGAIGTAQIADANITTAKIANLAVTNAQIADATIQSAKIGSVDAGTITVGTLSAARIGADTITATHIASDAITSNELAANSITAAKGQISDLAITTAKIADAQITTAKIANLAVTNAQIADATIQSAKIGSVDAGTITVGTLSAARIAAGSITADKVLLADITNYIENPDFEGDTVGQQARGYVANGNTSVVDISALGGTFGTMGTAGNGTGKAVALNALNGSNNDLYALDLIPVKIGDQFYIEYEARNLNAVGAGGAGVGFRTYGPTKAAVTWTTVATYGSTKSTTWSKKTGTYTVPSGTAYLQIWLTFSNNAETTNQFWIDNIVVRRKNGAELIVDGAIQAGSAIIGTGAIGTAQIANLAVTDAQIASATITSAKIANLDAAKITTGTLDANRIGADTITASHIASDAITANELAANSITAAKGQISDLAVTTAKIALLAVTDAQIASATITSAKIANLDAAKITTGTLDANRIGANTISAAKLVIGDFENLTTINEVYGTTVSSYGQTQVVGGYNTLVVDSGAFFMWRDQTGPVPFKNGDRLYYSFTAKATTATTVTVGCYIYNAASANRSTSSASINIGTTDTVVTGSILVPATDAGWGPSKTWVIGLQSVANKGIALKEVTVRRMNGGELLVDGTITAGSAIIGTGAIGTAQIANLAVTDAQIASATITSAKIANLDAGKITTGYLDANRLAANSITAASGIIASLDASKITVGTLSAARIASKSITTDKLVITSTDNLILEADFSNGAASWETVAVTKILNATAGRGTLPAMRFTGTVSTQTSLNVGNKVPVGSEDRFRGSMWIKSSTAAASGTFFLKAKAYTTASSSTNITIASNSAMASATWTNVQGISPVLPTGTIALEFFLEVTNATTGQITDIDYVGVTRAADGNLVVDGAIDGKTITGALIRTAASGARIQLDSTGLNGWDANGINYLNASSTGLTVTGTLTSKGIGHDYYNMINGQPQQIPVEIAVGGAVGAVGLGTQQWPPPPPSGVIPGFSFNPTNTSMYSKAQITADDGVYMSFNSGMTTADYNAWATAVDGNGFYINAGKPVITSGMSLAQDGAHFSKIVDAQGYKVGGLDMSNGETQVWDISGTMVAATIPVPRLQTFNYNATDSTSNALATTGTEYIEITNTGVYDIHWSYGQSGPTSADRNFLEIRTDGMSIPIARNSFANAEDSASAIATGIRLTAGQRINFEVYQWGSSRTFNSKVRLKRVSAPTPTTGYGSGNVTHTGDFTVTGGKFVQPIRHCTTNLLATYPPSGTLWGPGTMTRDASNSVGDDFVSFPTNDKFTVSETGVYAIHIFVANHSVTYSASRIFLKKGDASFIYAEGAKAEGDVWGFALTVPNLYLAAGSTCLINYYHAAGSTMQWDTTLRITKIQ